MGLVVCNQAMQEESTNPKPNRLAADESLHFDNETLYTSHALMKMVPRSLFVKIKQHCKTPIQGIYHGKAINLALEKIFLLSLNSPEPDAVPKTQYRKLTGRKKKNGGISHSGKDWFSPSEETF